MARPTDYKKEYCQKVIEHMSEGASLTSFAASIGCARSTINVWMEANPEFSEAVNAGKAKCASWWERAGRLGAVGEMSVNPTLVIFGLKNMASDDWRDKQEVDHTSTDGSMSPKSVDQAVVNSLVDKLTG